MHREVEWKREVLELERLYRLTLSLESAPSVVE